MPRSSFVDSSLQPHENRFWFISQNAVGQLLFSTLSVKFDKLRWTYPRALASADEMFAHSAFEVLAGAIRGVKEDRLPKEKNSF